MTLPNLSNQELHHTAGGSCFKHAYAIIRIDEFLDADTPIEHRISVKKVVREADEAEREVERLNDLQRDRGVRYFSQITRLEQLAQEPTTEENLLTNRLGKFISDCEARVNTDEKLEWLETIRVHEYIYKTSWRSWFSGGQSL